MAEPLKLLSSMATRLLLAELVGRYRLERGVAVELEAVGGVDAARRVAAGEVVDVVVLASGAIDELIEADRLSAQSRTNVVCSPMAVAVRSGSPRPDVGTESALRDAVRLAPSVGYSTGPSGTHFLSLIRRWGLGGELGSRIVQAPPGVPVGSLVASGEVAIGFQQLSELTHVAGIDVIGRLPPGAELMTYFTAAVSRNSAQSEAALKLLKFLTNAEHNALKRSHGLDPV